eukprot:4939099-Pyramimonas_sp.AAC.1
MVLDQLQDQVEVPTVIGQNFQLGQRQVELLSAKLIKNDWVAAVAASGPAAEGMRAGVVSAVTSRMGITHQPELIM